MATIYSSNYKNVDNEFAYAVKFPNKDIGRYDRVVNEENQESVLISANGILESYGPGAHRINRDLIPSPRKVMGITIGNSNPGEVEMWIVNQKTDDAFKCEIRSVEVQIPNLRYILSLDFTIQYGIEVINSEEFIGYFVRHGGNPINSISPRDIHRELFDKNTTLIKNDLRNFIEDEGLQIDDGDFYLDEISEALLGGILKRTKGKGLRFTHFAIDQISLDVSMLTPLKKKMLQENLGIETKDLIKRGFKSSKLYGQTDSQLTPIIRDNGKENRKIFSNEAEPVIVVCAQCAVKHMSTEKFCPSCGKKFMPCPKCGRDTLENAKRCVGCGIPLKPMVAPSTCHKCGSEVITGSPFCPHCGEKQLVPNPNIKICSRCKTQAPLTSKFCPKCGFKL